MASALENYRIIIGLEVHVQLLTETKLFCGCTMKFGEAPNTQVCPICLGMPGVLPVMNRKAFDHALRAAVALDCAIAPRTKFDRKNYFYPDLPKNYQISQYDLPFSSKGHLDVTTGGVSKRVGITRVHLEEDAGKLVHDDNGGDSRVDLNRAGTPLLEIVSEPDITSPEEAFAYLTELKSILRYLEVSDCNMEEGSLRCDANISLMPKGQPGLGSKVEIKNLNSFRAVEKSLRFEAERQAKALAAGDRIPQETRLWDPDREVTATLRSKEEAHDYRYFPEPDLVPVEVGAAEVAAIRGALPELPAAKRARFASEYRLPEYDCGVLTDDKALAAYFESAAKSSGDAKIASNWIMGEVTRVLNEKKIVVGAFPVQPERLAKLIKLVSGKAITQPAAKEVFAAMLESDKEPDVIVKEKGLAQISDEGPIIAAADAAIAKNPNAVADFKAGKDSAVKFLMGQVMKETRGKANPQTVEKIIREKLKG